jgi:hypothetical protein
VTDLNEYDVPSPNGGTMRVQLSDADAKAKGLLKAKKAAAPANKAKKAASNKKA